MIDIKRIRENPSDITEKLSDRLPDAKKIIEKIVSFDKDWRKAKKDLDEVNAKRKKITGKSAGAAALKKEQKSIEKKVKETEEKKDALLLSLPNIPLDITPKGKTEKDNKIIKTDGEPKKGRFKDYLSLKNSAQSIQGAEGISGARFSYIRGDAAKIEFALLSFAIKKLIEKGFELVFPPTIIKKDVMKAMGYLDQAGEQEVFQIGNNISNDELVLIGTGEQALGALYPNKIFEGKELPKKLLTFTPCYRREAGSYGKDTKGIIRQHQFEKLEMFAFTTKENSEMIHNEFLEIQEELMHELDLPYRVVDLATGDLGYPSARTIDIETWLPGQGEGEGTYRETHSTSNCTDYQARRLNTKYKSKDGKLEFVHTVNGTAFAMQRMIVALLENYQNNNGEFSLATLPDVLKRYL